MHWYMKENSVPKSFPIREREALLSELRELLRVAEMESCSFDGGFHTEFTPNDVTGYVKEVTKLWRGSWLVRPLKDLIARYDSGLTQDAVDVAYCPRCEWKLNSDGSCINGCVVEPATPLI